MERQPIGERAIDLAERHGDDYLNEGKRLLRRLGLAVLLAGAGVFTAGMVAAAWLANSVLHLVR